MSIEIDVDNNGAVDIEYGGTNASTTTAARISLNVQRVGIDNIADLRISDDGFDGEVVFVGGYTSIGDGGGGYFYWAAASEAAEDYGTVILPTGHTGAGRWLRIYDVLTPHMFGAVADGITDDLIPINRVIAAINTSGNISVHFGDGEYAISANPDVITSDNWQITGNGAATRLVMMSTAGINGTFFTVGDASNDANSWKISDMSFECQNASTLDGTQNVFNITRGTDGFIANIIAGDTGPGNGVGGFIVLGSNALSVKVQRIKIRDAAVRLYGPAEGIAFDLQWANVIRVGTVGITNNTPSVTGGVIGIKIHPEGEDPADGSRKTCDSGMWDNVEFNFPSDNIDHILLIDAAQGIVINQWFTNCVFDHSLEEAIVIQVPAGAHAAARINNIFFNNVRSYVDGKGSVLIDAIGDNDINNLVFAAGVLTGYDEAAIKAIGGASANISLTLTGVNFTDKENITPKAAIEAKLMRSLIVTGCKADVQLNTDTCTWTHLVKFTGNCNSWNITGNNAVNVTTELLDLAGMENFVGSMKTKNASGNISPKNSHISYTRTEDATTTPLMSIKISDETTCAITAIVDGVKTDGTDRASYEIKGTFYRTAAGNATQVGTTTSIKADESDATWVGPTFVISGLTVQVIVAGKAATVIDWGGSFDMMCR